MTVSDNGISTRRRSDVDVSRKVLNATGLYIQYREAQDTADAMNDQLGSMSRHMSEREYQAYVHITGMYDISHNGHMPPPLIHAESVPMPALTPEVLEAMDAERTKVD